MDELELLKRDWKENKTNDFKNYTEKELFAMTKKRSVSIAKWVFMIAVLELAFWILIVFFMSSSEEDEVYNAMLDKQPFIKYSMYILGRFFEILPFVFIGSLLYLNFKIRIEENPRRLMKKIMLMKNSVKWYIRSFLGGIVLFFILVLAVTMYQDFCENPTLDEQYFIMVLLGFPIFVMFMLVLVLFLRFIYHTVYGNLLWKLKQNYEELSKMEV